MVFLAETSPITLRFRNQRLPAGAPNRMGRTKMHRRLHVNTVIDLNITNMNMAAVGAPVPTLAREFERFPGTVYRLGREVAGTGASPDYCPIKTGASSNPNRSFLWCPYRPGLITMVPANLGHSIFTGRMSGCWLVRCTVNGAPYFAHIGTAHNAHDPATVAVKNAFKSAVGEGLIVVRSAFQPMCPTALNTLGAMSPRGNFFTFGISPAAAVAGAAVPAPPPSAGGGAGLVSAPFNAAAPKFQVVAKTQTPGQARLPMGF